MGLVYAEIELISGEDLVLHRRGYIAENQIKRVNVNALVDSGSYMLAINETIKVQLNLPKVDEQMAELAEGSLIKLEIVGPVEIRFENRRCNVDAMVLPGDSEVLLGAIPMEDLDVVIEPKQQRLIVNPSSPNIARKSLKSLSIIKVDEQMAELAEGSLIKLEIVGPIDVHFKNRSTTCRAMVLPGDSEVLLGAIPMEDLDVLIDPKQQRLIVNPSSPNIARKSLK
ncbi:MAG: aspartyl protease family protein [Microcystaceae cyanobacterium]